MSDMRWKNVPANLCDKYGFYLCRNCGNACPEGRRNWCSETCFRQYLTTANGSFVRAQLLERDRGICAECGVDAARMDAALMELKSDLLHPLLMSIHPMIVATLRAEGWANVKLRGHGSYPDAVEFSSCWEAHHIQAVVEGGGACGLENFRTLCFVCHKKVSAKQAGDRAKRRRTKKNEPAEIDEKQSIDALLEKLKNHSLR